MPKNKAQPSVELVSVRPVTRSLYLDDAMLVIEPGEVVRVPADRVAELLKDGFARPAPPKKAADAGDDA